MRAVFIVKLSHKTSYDSPLRGSNHPKTLALNDRVIRSKVNYTNPGRMESNHIARWIRTNFKAYQDRLASYFFYIQISNFLSSSTSLIVYRCFSYGCYPYLVCVCIGFFIQEVPLRKFGRYISANISPLLTSPSAFLRTWDRLSIEIDKSHYELDGRGIFKRKE